MIVVVADTSPLNYLVQINCDHVLPSLYQRVFVPAAVVEELNHPNSVAAGTRVVETSAVMADSRTGCRSGGR